ncbi:MAG: DHH family phosphoesterase [Patescibacteria group bacterium]
MIRPKLSKSCHMLAKIKDILGKSNNLLVLTHASPDHDAICSILLFKSFLQNHYSHINVDLVTNEVKWPQYESWGLLGLNTIKNLIDQQTVNLNLYDYVFFLDTNRVQGNFIENTNEFKKKAIIIDHHTSKPEIDYLIEINEHRASTTEQVYFIFKKLLGNDLVLTKEEAYLAQVGLIADTNRFLFCEQITSDSYKLMEEMSKINKLNIEGIYNKMIKNTKNSVYVFKHLLQNTVFEENMAYTFVSPKFIEKNEYTKEDIKCACTHFLQSFVRTLEGVDWGFLVKPSASEKNVWRVSLRANNGTIKVVDIAKQLNGGGHDYAAAGSTKAKYPWEAVENVLSIVESASLVS